MKEDQQSTLTMTEPSVLWNWPEDELLDVRHARDEVAVLSVDEIRPEASEIVLLFLDLAKITGESAYLEVAAAGAKRSVYMWKQLAASASTAHHVITRSSINGLSRSAFALIQAWKATENPVFGDAGLNIIRYIAEMESADGQGPDAIHAGETR